MDLIPVVDLMRGRVVHARMGMRSAYAPVQSTLCAGADPGTIVQALLDLHPFRGIYFADLDAIQREGSHLRTLARLRERFAGTEFWVDAGIADDATLAQWMASGAGRPVIGSETLSDAAFLARALHRAGADPPVLSLDFLGETFRGPRELLDDPSRWPDSVLAMNLRKVGAGDGPDLELVSRLAIAAPHCRVYAAGGVRNVDDLSLARAAGAAGALIATALHDGSIGAAHLHAFAAAERA